MRIAAIAVALLLICAVPPAGGAEPDGFIDDLVVLLESGVDDRVILRWLDKQPPLDRPLDADDLARLSRAGATSRLLLALVGEAPSPLDPPASLGPVFGSRKLPVLQGEFIVDFGIVHTLDLDTDVRFDIGPAVGTFFRLEDLLGFDNRETTFRSSGSFRYKPKRGIEWSFVRFARDAQRSVSEELEILGLTFEIGARVDSSLDNSLSKIAYQHLFINDGKTAAGLSFGIGVFTFDYRVVGEINAIGQEIVRESASRDDIAPLPTIGLRLEHAITPRLIFRSNIDFFAFKVVRFSDYRGRIFDANANLQYFVSDLVSIGGGLVGTAVRIEYEGEDPWDVQTDLGGVQLFVGFAF